MYGKDQLSSTRPQGTRDGGWVEKIYALLFVGRLKVFQTELNYESYVGVFN
jgi:hypothetical protein